MRYYVIILFMMGALMAKGQLTICGKVVDSKSGMALRDASILVKPGNQGAYTDKDGNFCLTMTEAGEFEILVYFTGYKNQKITLLLKGNDTTLNDIGMQPAIVDLKQTVVTASRYEQKILDAPARMNVITPEMVMALPANNIDALLKSVPNVFINRTQGIYSKSAGITMHGLSGTARTLVMLDGVPLNKTSGGSVNWDIVNTENIERVEVYKGPGSALYGNNAMAGVVHMISRKPGDKLEGKVRIGGGTYNTWTAFTDWGTARELKNGGILKASINGFYRKSKGYVPQVEENLNEYDVRTHLEEWNSGGLLSYQSTGGQEVSLIYRYRDGKYGSGEKVYEKDGDYDRYRTHFAVLSQDGQAGAYKLMTKAFLQLEKYDRQNESINNLGNYKLSDTYSTSADGGIWFSAARNIFQNHVLLVGLDIKYGSLDAEDLYRTSADYLAYGGKMFFGGLFVQDELPILRDKLELQAGLRFDVAWFHDGFLEVSDPTNATGFIHSGSVKHDKNSWIQLSPRLSIRYSFDGMISTYISYSHGFMPPKLDDLTRSGKISKGFKVANPALTPEKANTLEWGWNMNPDRKLSITPSVYWTMGSDFQYFVGTGDSLESGGDIRPVFQRQNISKVSILGGEMQINYLPVDKLDLFINYAYNHGEIKEYNGGEGESDLEGNMLIESPVHLLSMGINWDNPILPVTALFTYTGKQWYDDENTSQLDDYMMVDIKLYRIFFRNLILALSIENLLDTEYTDRKGLTGPGRFIMFEVTYKL